MQAFVPFFVRPVANTSMASVNAILVGRVKNVRYVTMSAKCPIATDTDIVSAESVNALAVTRGNTVKMVRRCGAAYPPAYQVTN